MICVLKYTQFFMEPESVYENQENNRVIFPNISLIGANNFSMTHEMLPEMKFSYESNRLNKNC